jgi:hypothetical protein
VEARNSKQENRVEQRVEEVVEEEVEMIITKKSHSMSTLISN